ncbi:17666_t:CDS:1 [Gigaspora margarita]|uniref:17666_t:CDS:1 n=1 Tax=Gigaspora margarita TaxID=4874 RepID=A0ABN7VI03_GIGMA|nr:17666_t:CDS:1 [Gigaspora margarita]
MDSQNVSQNAQRKRKERMIEIPYQREMRQIRDRERKCEKRATKALEVREVCLENHYNQYQKHQKQLIADENDNHEQIPQASTSNTIDKNDNHEQISQASASNTVILNKETKIWIINTGIDRHKLTQSLNY